VSRPWASLTRFGQQGSTFEIAHSVTEICICTGQPHCFFDLGGTLRWLITLEILDLENLAPAYQRANSDIARVAIECGLCQLLLQRTRLSDLIALNEIGFEERETVAERTPDVR
jgi:hypothetical protein